MTALEIKYLEDTKKTKQEYFWYVAVFGVGLVLAEGVTFAKLFL